MRRIPSDRRLTATLCANIFRAFAAAVSAILILLGPTPAAHAQPGQSNPTLQETQARQAAMAGAAIAAEFRKIASSTPQLDRLIFNTYGTTLTPEKLEVARRVVRSNLTDENLSAYIGKVIAPLIATNPSMEDVITAAMEGVVSLQLKGLARLSPELQANFITHSLGTMANMEPADCKAAALGQMNSVQAARLERRYIAGLPLGKFEAITNLYQEAAKAQLRGFPDARQLNDSQARLAQSVFEKSAEDLFTRSVPLGVLERLASSGFEALPAREACLIAYLSNAAILDMPEPYRTWQLTRFMLSLQ